MKILLTGGTGFIGSNLLEKLKENNIIYLITRKKGAFRHKNIIEIEADLSQSDFAALLPENIDCVIHLAQSRAYREFPSGSHDMRKINIDATGILLDWARQSGASHFIYSSTANVYSAHKDRVTESYQTNPNSFYAASKLSAEFLIRQYSSCFAVSILRLFTVFGEGQENMLFPNITDRVIKREPIFIQGKKGLILSPIYVDDVINIILALLRLSGNKFCETINICGDNIISLHDLSEMIGNYVGITPVYDFQNEESVALIGSNARLHELIPDLTLSDFHSSVANVIKNFIDVR